MHWTADKGSSAVFLPGGSRGIFIPIFAFVTVAAFFLLAALLSYGYRSAKVSELQAAADAAAHTGAALLCWDGACWEDSLRAASGVLEHQSDGAIALNAGNRVTTASIPTWSVDSGRFQVTIERGLWGEAGGVAGFTSLEGGVWSYPGVPAPFTANAVRVSVTRAALEHPLNLLGSDPFDVQLQATAVTATLRPMCAAPFALPICSLLGAGGTLQPDLCAADRYFTEAARYCPEGDPNCGIYPTFDNVAYRNRRDSLTTGEVVYRTLGSPPENVSYKYDLACFFIPPRFDHVSDHFGVVGLPGAHSTTEESIRNMIGDLSGSGCQPTTVGDIFGILPDGLNDPEPAEDELSPTQVALLNRMESGATSVGTVLRGIATGTYAVPLNPFPAELTLPDPPLIPFLKSKCDFRSFEPIVHGDKRMPYGICNSRFSYVRNYFAGSQTPEEQAELRDETIPDLNSQRLWQVQIPVIADFGSLGEPCAGFPRSDGSIADADPAVVTGHGHDWRVVAFVTANIYDSDVGSKPPMEFTQEDLMATGLPLPQLAEMLKKFPYFFQTDLKARQCNLVRARVDCSGFARPSSFPFPEIERKAVLVR